MNDNDNNFNIFQRSDSEAFKDWLWDRFQCSSNVNNCFVDDCPPDVSDFNDLSHTKFDKKASVVAKSGSDSSETVHSPQTGECVNKSPESHRVVEPSKIRANGRSKPLGFCCNPSVLVAGFINSYVLRFWQLGTYNLRVTFLIWS